MNTTDKLLAELEASEQSFQAKLIPSLLKEINNLRKQVALEKQAHQATKNDLEKLYKDYLDACRASVVKNTELFKWKQFAVFNGLTCLILITTLLTLGVM